MRAIGAHLADTNTTSRREASISRYFSRLSSISRELIILSTIAKSTLPILSTFNGLSSQLKSSKLHSSRFWKMETTAIRYTIFTMSVIPSFGIK